MPRPAAVAALAALLLTACAATAPLPATPAPVPLWLLEHMQSQVGRWQADNAAYKGAGEPYDRYLVEWRWGPGKTSLAGSLSGQVGSQPPVEFWQYRVYWHPGERVARIDQWGHGGALLSGTLRPDGEENGEPVFEMEQTWYATSGKTARTRHRTVHGQDQQAGASYDWKDGAWVADRQYTWTRLPQ